MAIQVIPPQTTAFTSDGIVLDGDLIPATIITNGLSDGEEIGIEVNNGNGWEQVRAGNAEFKIDYADPHTKVIRGRCRIRFVKGITTNPVSLALAVKDNV